MELQISIISNERDTLQAETQTLRARLSELADVQQEFAALQMHDAAVSERLSVVEEEHAVSVPVCLQLLVLLVQGHDKKTASSSRGLRRLATTSLQQHSELGQPSKARRRVGWVTQPHYRK